MFVKSEHTVTGWPTMEPVSYMTNVILCDDLEASMYWPPSFEALEIGSYRLLCRFCFCYWLLGVQVKSEHTATC